MNITILLIFAGAVLWWLVSHYKTRSNTPSDLSVLPEHFVVFDLETTGLDSSTHEIIEIGAIRVNRDSTEHDTFQALVIPKGRIGTRITELTGITKEMVAAEGEILDHVLAEFREFIGDLPMVAFNAPFDAGFLRAACVSTSTCQFTNEIYCALDMARRAWPGRDNYRLAGLAKDGNLSDADTHRALGDCQRAMIVYCAAASILGTHR